MKVAAPGLEQRNLTTVTEPKVTAPPMAGQVQLDLVRLHVEQRGPLACLLAGKVSCHVISLRVLTAPCRVPRVGPAARDQAVPASCHPGGRNALAGAALVVGCGFPDEKE